MSATPRTQSASEHTALPARPDLIRLIIGIFGVGSSGPLIAMSAMPVPTLIFWRNLGGSLITLPFALRHKVDRFGAQWAIFAGFLLSLHFMGFFVAMRMTSVAAGTAIAALQPIFAALYLRIRGGYIPGKAWLGMLLSFIGVLVVTGIDIQLDRKSFLGDLAALVSGALAASYMLVGSHAQKTLQTTTYTSICYLTCALTALPITLIAGYELFSFAAREWLILAGLIVGAQLLGHTMFNLTLKRVSPAVVSLIVFFEVPVAAFLASIFGVGKQPPASIYLGVLLILVGCIFFVSRTKSENVMTVE
jgi:drug/metabolite transporter (DMT)-like permease